MSFQVTRGILLEKHCARAAEDIPTQKKIGCLEKLGRGHYWGRRRACRIPARGVLGSSNVGDRLKRLN